MAGLGEEAQHDVERRMWNRGFLRKAVRAFASGDPFRLEPRLSDPRWPLSEHPPRPEEEVWGEEIEMDCTEIGGRPLRVRVLPNGRIEIVRAP